MGLDVLLIDDDANYRSLMSQALLAAGLAARAVGDAEEGYRVALEARPRAVVTDVQLPGMSGIDLCRKLRAHPELGGTPILIITGTYSPQEGRMRASGLETCAWLQKPFRIPEFLEAVRSLLGT